MGKYELLQILDCSFSVMNRL